MSSNNRKSYVSRYIPKYVQPNLKSNLTMSYCLQYRADMAKYELWNVFRERGESNYHMYKCLCKYQEEIIEDTPKYFRCEMLEGPNYHWIKDISNTLFFQKMSWEVVEGSVDNKGSLRSNFRNNYLIDFKVYR